MAESCAQKCDMYAFCNQSEGLQSNLDMQLLLFEADEYCSGSRALCYVKDVSDKMLGLVADVRATSSDMFGPQR